VVKLPQWAVLPRRCGARVALGLLLAGVLALGVGEALGWPFLGPAVERWLSARLDRSVSLIGSGDRSALRLRLLGGVSVQTPRLVVASPVWSRAGAMLEADDARLKLRYSDLFAWRRGGPLHVDTLTARRLAVRVERLKDGRASWQFGPPREGRPMLDGVVFGEVGVQDGHARIDDAQLDLALQGKFAWKDDGLVADAQGRYRGLPTQASARTGPACNCASMPAVPSSNSTAACATRSASGPSTAATRCAGRLWRRPARPSA
jgi:hypothetical protein